MSYRKSTCILIAVAALGLGGCAMDPYQTSYPGGPAYPGSGSPNYPNQEPARYGYGYGYVDSIETVAAERREGMGIGAVGGAVIGGIVGHQIGSGSGNTAATIGGAVLGGVVGHQVEQQVRNRQAASAAEYQFRVRMDDGSYQTVRSDSQQGIRVGDRVRVEGNSIYLM